jgi:hypothetical protein
MKTLNPEIEKHRVRTGPLGSDASFGNNGLFKVEYAGSDLRIIAGDGEGWDHVSVSLAHRTPTWAEMCYVKNLFFEEEETVLQYHPKKSKYINCHPFVLHLWRKQGEDYELPPRRLIA